MTTNILMEVTPRTRSGTLDTVRMSHVGAGPEGAYLDGKQWPTVICKRPSIGVEFFDDEGNLKPSETRRGSIEFRLSEVYENEIWSTYVWNNAPAKVWIGERGKPFTDYKLIHNGSVSALSRDGMTASLELIGPEALLDTDFLTLTYAGTDGAEGDEDMKGQEKPWCSGYARNVDPVVVDQIYWVYQVHGYGPILDIPAVYERAEALEPTKMKASVSTYAALIALDLQPAEWAICLPLGMFRLGGAPRYKVTADVKGAKDGSSTPMDIATIVPHLLKKAGVAADKIGDFSDFTGVTWDLYVEGQVTVGEVVRDALAQAGGALLCDGDGVWFGVDTYKLNNPLYLTADRSTAPLVRPGTIKQLTVADPVFEVKIGYKRCWSVHDKEDVSPALDEALTAAVEGAQAVAGQVGELADQVANFTGVDVYPFVEAVEEMAAVGLIAVTANDKAARAYRDEAFAQVDSLRHDVLSDGESYAEAIDGLTTTTGSLQSAITNEAALRTTGDAANASAISIVATKADNNAAAIVTEANSRTTALSAVATQISQIQASVSTVNAAVTAETTARSSALAAETQARTQQISSLDTSLRAVISTEATTRANKDNALTTTIDQLSSQLADANARITTEKNASVTRDNANASSIQTVQANLNGTNNTLALVQQTATATSNRLGVVEGKYVLSVQGGTDVAGMTVAAGGGTSKIVFQAGAIAFRNPGNGAADDLMEYVNGELRVKAARIGSATINSAHIVSLAIGTDKMAYNAATVPVSTFSAPVIGLPEGSWTNIQTATIVSSGAPIFISCSHCMETEPYADRDVDIRVLRDGVQIYLVEDLSFASGSGFGGGGGDWLLQTLNLTDTPGAGAHTYQFQGKTNDGASSKNRSLFLLETKR